MRISKTLLRPWRRLCLVPIAALSCALANAQVTPGTIDTGFLVGDPSSSFATAFPYPASPKGNPFWEPNHPDFPNVMERAQLGKALFWDEQLSSDNTMACGTCHAMTAGGLDGRGGALANNGKTGSPGMYPQDPGQDYQADPLFAFPAQVTDLKRVTDFGAPTMINAVFFRQLFWRLRAGPSFDTFNGSGIPLVGFADFAAPESLAAFPPVSDVEMGHDKIEWQSGFIQKKLANSEALRFATAASVPADIQWLYQKNYAKLFDHVFGPLPGGANPVTRERVAMAIAHYLRTLVSDKAPVFQPFGQGGLTKPMHKAFEIMRQNSCFACHSSTGNPQFNSNGAGFQDKFDSLLSGGFLASVFLPPPGDTVLDPNGNPVTANVKVPTLINMGLGDHFFHSGQIQGVANLLDFYNQELPTQPAFVFNPPLNAFEKQAMLDLWTIGFVDPRVANAQFPFDRPDLYSERLTDMGTGPIGAFPAAGKENRYGIGTAGTTGIPFFFANNPAANNDQWFKTGIGRGKPFAGSTFGMSMAQGPGTPFLIDPNATIFSPFQALNNQGYRTWRITDPGAPTLSGVTWFGQWLVSDNAAPGGLAATEGAAFVLQ